MGLEKRNIRLLTRCCRMLTRTPRDGMLEMSFKEDPEECLLWGAWLALLLEPGLWAMPRNDGDGPGWSVMEVNGVPGGESESFVQEGGEGREFWAGDEKEGDGSPTMEFTICCDEQ